MKHLILVTLLFITCALSSFAGKKEITFSGTITQKEEIWDRRTNTEMGRPDILERIELTIAVDKVTEGKYDKRSMMVTINTHSLLARNNLSEGDQATFYVKAEKASFYLTKVEDLVKKKAVEVQAPIKTTPKPAAQKNEELSAQQINTWLETPEKIPGKLIQQNKSLQEKATLKIAQKYNLNNPKHLVLTSNSGPVPPPGGYVYWGVTGIQDGKEMVWQQGKGLRSGNQLEDPKRYQK